MDTFFQFRVIETFFSEKSWPFFFFFFQIFSIFFFDNYHSSQICNLKISFNSSNWDLFSKKAEFFFSDFFPLGDHMNLTFFQRKKKNFRFLNFFFQNLSIHLKYAQIHHNGHFLSIENNWDLFFRFFSKIINSSQIGSNSS